jgi:hypothetical protein
MTLLATGALPSAQAIRRVSPPRTECNGSAPLRPHGRSASRASSNYLCILLRRRDLSWLRMDFSGTGRIVQRRRRLLLRREEAASRNERAQTARSGFVGMFPRAADVMRHAVGVTALKGAPLRTAMAGSALSRPGLLVLGRARPADLLVQRRGHRKGARERNDCADAVDSGPADEAAAKVIADTTPIGFARTFRFAVSRLQDRRRTACQPRLRQLARAQGRKQHVRSTGAFRPVPGNVGPGPPVLRTGLLRSFLS